MVGIFLYARKPSLALAKFNHKRKAI